MSLIFSHLHYQNHKIIAYKQPTGTVWHTLGGTFTTRRKQSVKFRLPEFSNSKTIDWKFHIDETTKPDQAQYDMIIGTDLMEELGIDLSFNRKVIEWADVCIPMKERGTVSDRATTQDLYNLATSAPVLRMSEDRHNEIIKLMYSKVDIDQHVKTLTRLTTTQQNQLATVLKQYDGM